MADSTIAPPTVPRSEAACSGLLATAKFANTAPINSAKNMQLARQNTYALILMDMQMPHVNGVEASKAIRLLPDYACTPILEMTANAFNEDRQACIDAGMNDHIAKLVNPANLYETLLMWLERN